MKQARSSSRRFASAGGRRQWRSVAAVLVFAALAAGGCDMSGRQTATAQDNLSQPGYFTVPVSQLSHLKISRVENSSWPVVLQTTGTVDFDADHTTPVITQVGGPIARLVADLGTRVKPGDPLLYVSSPDLSGAVSAYRKAQNRLDLARRTLDRNRDLLSHKVIAQKDLEASQADYNDAFTEAQNDLQALKIFGVTENDLQALERQDAPIRPELAVRSPIAGVVVQKLVSPGQLVQAGATTCFLVSNPAAMWIQGHLHDDELTSVHVGDRAEVHSGSAPGLFAGRVSYIGAMLDPATRTTPVRIVTENRQGLLKKDQFVDVTIHSGVRRTILTVPTSAVLHNTENLPFVYVQVGSGRFAERLIKTGVQLDDSFEVLSGLKAGEDIVTEGSVFLQFAETYQK
jgi:membrane fusion protein, heavy metal efflux system